MSTTMQSIFEKCEELDQLLTRLTPGERESEVIQDLLHSLTTPGASKRRRVTDRIVHSEVLHRGTKSHNRPSGAVALTRKIVERLARDAGSKTNVCLFSVTEISPRTDPALVLLETYFTHATRTGTELRVLSLLVAHAIDCNTISGSSHKDVVQSWATTLDKTSKSIVNVERAGRCCIEVMEGRDLEGRACLDLAGVGLIAMMEEYTTSLRELAGHGRKLLRACMAVEGFETRAVMLAPNVCSGISRIAQQCGFRIDKESRLGLLLDQYDHLRISAEHHVTTESDGNTPTSTGGSQQSPGAIWATYVASPSPIEQGLLEQSREERETVVVSDDWMLIKMADLIKGIPLESVPEALLLRGSDRQHRWSEQGVRTTICLRDTSIQNCYADIFKDRTSLMRLLDKCVQHHILHRCGGELQTGYSAHRSSVLSRDGLILIFYACPRDAILEPSFHAIMSGMLPHLKEIFDSLDTSETLDQDSALLLDAFEAWLSFADTRVASHWPYLPRMMQRYLASPQIPIYLRLKYVYVRSVFLRRQEKYCDSDKVIEESLHHSKVQGIRDQCWAAELRLSLAENAILRNEYSLAESAVNDIELPDFLGYDMNCLVLRLYDRKWATQARICRFMGRFENAINPLNYCFGVRRKLAHSNISHIARPLADVCIELGQYGRAKSVLDDCLTNDIVAARPGTRAYNRLLLSQADLEIAQHRYQTASELLSHVAQAFQTRPPTSQTDQLDHVRAVIASSRIMMHTKAWSKLLSLTTTAMRLTTRYSSFTATNYYIGYTLLLRAIAQLHLAFEDLNAAVKCVQEPRHFMTGVGTFDRKAAHESMKLALDSCAKGAHQLTQSYAK